MTAFNALSIREALEMRSAEGYEMRGIGQSEALITIALLAYIGSMIFWQEWQKNLPEVGGGRQSISTRLAMPRASRWIFAKFVVVTLLSAAVMSLALAGGVIVSQIVLRGYSIDVDAALILRTLLYGVLMALFSAGLTLLLRSGLVPTVWLVANSTVVSIGYLVAQKWPGAWYFPDTVGSALIRIDAEPGMPSSLMAGVFMSVWVVLVWISGIIRERVSDE
ncbi:MAG: hypothetical protein PUK59_04470 [Actinomycetaceae bacterium]|nr:hypothetical protein [Actinomycetaceae bacterium]MDY5855260.1 hypothetical protein [Arcanobacterium sp.]